MFVAFEYEQRDLDLDLAFEYATKSASTFGNLVADECSDKRRLPVLNSEGRRYVRRC